MSVTINGCCLLAIMGYGVTRHGVYERYMSDMSDMSATGSISL